MTERPKPYIGISGVININQQNYLMDQFVRQGLSEAIYGRRLALGVKAVHKTQLLDTENKYGSEWYPVGEQSFASALDNGDFDALRVAQTYFDTEHVGNTQYRQKFVDRIRRRGKAWLNAIQFDMLPWHEDSSLLPFVEDVKSESGLAVLLQAHGESMRLLGPEGVVRKLSEYAHAIDYVLFDASHGKGVRMDTGALKPFLEAGYGSDELAHIGFSVAGGLNAEVVRQDLPELLEFYPDVSWDAEGQLHPTRSDGTRPIDMDLAVRYLESSREVLRKV